MNIGFIGLGKLGLPCAMAIESKGHSVIGYDSNPKVSEVLKTKVLPYKEKGAEELLKKSEIKVVSISEVVKSSEIIFVAVQTPHDEKYEGITRLPKERADFDYSYLKKAVKDVSEEIEKLKEKRVLIIISTVLPCTIRREIIPLLSEYVQLCYNPFFIAMGTTIDDFTNPEFVLFGRRDKEAADKAKEFYKTIHNKEFLEMSIESAELAKVSYNTYITAKITIANTIMEIAHKIPGCNCDEIVNALKHSTDRIISPKYLNGGMGDGGGCHPRDGIALSWLAKKLNLSHDIYEDLMKAREDQTEWLAKLIKYTKKNIDLPVIILGYTFKKETNLIVGSPAILLMNILDEMGIKYNKFDPTLDDIEKCCEVFDKQSIYFIGCNHDVFRYHEFPEGSVVLDPWGIIEDKKEISVIRIGRN